MSMLHKTLEFLHLRPKTPKPPKPEHEALKGLCVTTCRVEPIVVEEKIEVCLEFPFLGQTYRIKRRATRDDPEAVSQIVDDVALHLKSEFGIELPEETRALLWVRVSEQLHRDTA